MKKIKKIISGFVLFSLIVFTAGVNFTPAKKAQADGEILVSVVPSTETIAPGESFTVDIVVDPQGVNDIITIQTNFEFDPSLVQADSVTLNDLADPWSDSCDPPSGWCSPGIDNDAGIIGSWISAFPFDPPGVFPSTTFTLLTIGMTAKTGVSGESCLRLPDSKHEDINNNLLFVDSDFGPLPYELTNGSITIGASDVTSPTITSVTSSHVNGSFKAGEVIDITVAYDEVVNVVTTGGTPTLALNSDGSAIYNSGAGTDTLIFRYTVGAGENSPDLDYSATNSLALNGGTIKDAAGNDAVLTLPNPGEAGSLGVNKDIVIDAVLPSIESYTLNGQSQSVAFNPDLNEKVEVAVTASENVEWVSLKIENISDSGIYKFYYPTGKCDGKSECEQLWNGSLSAGTLVDGGYKIKVNIEDAAENVFNDYLAPYIITVETNSPPVMQSVTITPDPAYTDTDLTATPIANDDDGDEITFSYQWHKNGTDINGAKSEKLASNKFDKNDVITVTVTPNDGIEDGNPMTSAGLTIFNSAPTQPAVSLTDPAYDSDDLVCVPSGSTDADGDDIVYSYGWQKDGIQATLTTNTVNASYTSVGEVWKCIVTPNDGINDGAAGEDSTTVLADPDIIPPAIPAANIIGATIQDADDSIVIIFSEPVFAVDGVWSENEFNFIKSPPNGSALNLTNAVFNYTDNTLTITLNEAIDNTYLKNGNAIAVKPANNAIGDAAGNPLSNATVDGTTVITGDVIGSIVILTYDPDRTVNDSDTVVITATFNEKIEEGVIPTIAIETPGNGDLSAADITKISNTVWTYSWDVPSGTDENGTAIVTITATDLAGNANQTAVNNTREINNTSTADIVSPSEISDLNVSNISGHTLKLNWTATGDDGNIGTAGGYDIRYSTTAITDSATEDEKNTWWSDATPISSPSPPKPKEAGEPQSVEVNGLNSGTTYYFAIKISDEVPNTSSFSNIASAVTSLGGGETPLPSDTNSPVITLLGNNSVNLFMGNTYEDAGATAFDDVDGNITANIATTGLPIDTDVAGTHIITYNVSDSAGNPAEEITRTVIVLPIEQDQTPIEQNMTVDVNAPEILIGDNAPSSAIINVPSEITNAQLNVSALVSGDSVKSAVIPLSLTINSNTSAGEVNLQIPQGIQISGDLSWTGEINLPQIQENSSVNVTSDSNYNVEVTSVIEIGFGNVLLNFNKAVRIKITGQAGKYVGYSRSGVFTQITDICTADSQITSDALSEGAECKIDAGSDLIIWTKHFTKFATYTQTAIAAVAGGATIVHNYSAAIDYQRLAEKTAGAPAKEKIVVKNTGTGRLNPGTLTITFPTEYLALNLANPNWKSYDNNTGIAIWETPALDYAKEYILETELLSLKAGQNIVTSLIYHTINTEALASIVDTIESATKEISVNVAPKDEFAAAGASASEETNESEEATEITESSAQFSTMAETSGGIAAEEEVTEESRTKDNLISESPNAGAGLEEGEVKGIESDKEISVEEGNKESEENESRNIKEIIRGIIFGYWWLAALAIILCSLGYYFLDRGRK